MNRAWIPAGALASVSIAGLIALGPLTDSLHTPVSFPSVVTVSAPAAKSSAVAVSFPAAVVGKTSTAALTRGGAARPSQTNSDIGQVSAKISQRPHTPTVRSSPPAPSAQATPVKKKTPKRPTSIGGSTGSNGDVGLASGAKGGAGGGGEQSATPGVDTTP